jgi:hypothetical protein
MGKQASVAAAVTGAGAGAGAGVGAGAGAGVGAGAGAAGFPAGAAAGVVLAESPLEELPEPQPVIAKQNKNPSGANARSALDR